MILSKEVENRWNNKHKKRYIDLGYIFTKCGDIFNVKVEDLSPKSHIKIKVKCDVCDKEKMTQYASYNLSISNGCYYACSEICSSNKSKLTFFKKYGCETPMQNEKVKNKYVQTCLLNHGVEYPMQNKDIYEKSKQTCLKNHGVEYPTQNNEVCEKSRQKSLEKYGVEYPAQSEIVKEKVKKTNIERYGFEYAIQNKDIYEKSKQTCLKNHGVEYPTQNIKVMEKIIQTNIDRYGEVFSKLIPKYNPNSIVYLDMISDILNIPIQHAVNGGEKKFQKYWVDGYIEQYNICIEWDENYHFSIKQKQKDLKREKFLIENHNCKIIRINENDFLKDVEMGIKKISIEIKILIDNKLN